MSDNYSIGAALKPQPSPADARNINIITYAAKIYGVNYEQI